MINAKPRFGLEGERLFDYATSRYMDPVGVLEEPAGEWDLARVAELLRAGSTVEAAFTSKAAAEDRQLMQDVHAKQVHALNAENADLRKLLSQEAQMGSKEIARELGQSEKVLQANKDFMADASDSKEQPSS